MRTVDVVLLEMPVNGLDAVPLMHDELCAVATIIGPVLAVQTQKRFEICRALCDRRMQLFRLRPMMARWKRAPRRRGHTTESRKRHSYR